jgi:hypothetical protein
VAGWAGCSASNACQKNETRSRPGPKSADRPGPRGPGSRPSSASSVAWDRRPVGRGRSVSRYQVLCPGSLPGSVVATTGRSHRSGSAPRDLTAAQRAAPAPSACHPLRQRVASTQSLVTSCFPRSNAPGCVRWRQRRWEGSGGWWPTSPSSRWAGRPTTPGSWPPTTRRICPATASPRAAGTAPAPPAWGCRPKHRRPGSRPCSRAATQPRVSCWGAHMAATRCRPSTWSCARPKASRSATDSATRPPARRCWPPTTLASTRWSPTWTDTWGPTRPWRCPARARPAAAGRGVRPPESAVHHCRSVTAASSSGRTTRQRAGLSRPPAGGTGRCAGAGR